MMKDEENQEKPSFAELIRAAEMLSSLLPPKRRNYPAAEKYYLQAYRLKPTNSKVNHKLGIFYLIAPEVNRYTIVCLVIIAIKSFIASYLVN
jgi:hypothetical protein